MKMVYIAGPYTGKDTYTITENIRKAKVLGDEVIKLGHYPAIPHTNTALCEGLADYQFFIDGTMTMMLRCDAVLVVDNWTNSSGTRGEILAASKAGIPVFFNKHDLAVWLEDGTYTEGCLVQFEHALDYIHRINNAKELATHLLKTPI